MKTTLTICIPTYNREEELRGNLNHLVKAYNYLAVEERKKINIFISDNHSDNYDVKSLLTSFQGLLPLEYIVHDTNMGATKNFEFCYRKFHSTYVWLLSDDEFLYDYSLKHLFDLLSFEKPDIVFINFAKNKAELKLNKDEIVNNKDLFISRLKNKPTLISSLIFKQVIIDRIEPRFLNTNLHQYYYFLKGVIDTNKYAIVNKEIFFSPYPNNSGGYNWFNTFGNELYDIIDEIDSLDVISKNIFSDIKRTVLTRQIIPVFFNLKIKKDFTKNFSHQDVHTIFRLIFKRNKRFISTWIFLIPIFLIPSKILIKIKSLYNERHKYV